MLALWLIVIVGVMSARIVAASHDTSRLVANLRSEAVARYAAESGVLAGKVAIEQTLTRVAGTDARERYLNSIDEASVGGDGVSLGDARYTISYVDVSSRLDVNWADAGQLTRFFEKFTDPASASIAARAIRRRITGERAADEANGQIGAPLKAAMRLLSLEELRGIPGLSEKVLNDAAPFLTVDGDGRINGATASRTVLASAAGELEKEPSRILVIARGWLAGHPLTHEIQAVYGVEGDRLVFVRWRERDL